MINLILALPHFCLSDKTFIQELIIFISSPINFLLIDRILNQGVYGFGHDDTNFNQGASDFGQDDAHFKQDDMHFKQGGMNFKGKHNDFIKVPIIFAFVDSAFPKVRNGFIKGSIHLAVVVMH